MNEEFYKEFTAVLRKFLKEQGGYENGFETYVGGTIRPKSYSYMYWMTPRSCELTFKERQKLGAVLYDQLYEICEKYNEFDIRLEEIPREHGVYETRIMKIVERTFRL